MAGRFAAAGPLARRRWAERAAWGSVRGRWAKAREERDWFWTARKGVDTASRSARISSVSKSSIAVVTCVRSRWVGGARACGTGGEVGSQARSASVKTGAGGGGGGCIL